MNGMNNFSRPKGNFLILAAILFSAFIFQGCNKDDDGDPVDPIDEVEGENIKLTNNILVDSDGKTLYFFTMDVNGTSNCNDATCLSSWPVFFVENIKEGTGLNASDFNNITRTDGEKQTTYKGWPLYYFANDNAAGETKGEGINNVWFVAKPNYSIMLANAQLVGNDGKNYLSSYQEGVGITQYFVDSNGRTLYAFLPDEKNKNNFTNPDFSNDAVWPIFHTNITTLPSTIQASDFDEIDVFGKPQLTFRGWPLYYFGQDTERGHNKGVSVPNPGVWPIVNNDTEEAPEAAPEVNVMLSENNTFGNIIVDANGITLYYFARDVSGESKCAEGTCLNNWPVFYRENIVPGEGLDAGDFSSIIREGGEKQTTYKGWPLYYFANDSEAGDTNGDDVNNVWFVAKPDYSIMLANEQLIGNDGKNYTNAYVEGEGITQYFVDSEGRALYAFTNDANNDNNFTSENFSNNAAWPIFFVEIASLPSTVNAEDFEVIDVFGESQLTYKGWPLYYFGQDAERGENKGVSVPSPGVWPVVNTSTLVAP